MPSSKKLNLIGQFLLFTATLAWGTSFLILKETISQVPAFYVIALRFLFAGVVLALVFFKRFKKLDKKTFIAGVVIGLSVTAAYLAQTLGLTYTTPGRNAFVTSSYCVMCPFLMWAIFKQKPKLINVVSAVLCLLGIGLIALSGEGAGGADLLIGDGLTLIGALFFAFQIIFIFEFQKQGLDNVLMLIFNFLTVGVLFMICSLVFELPVRGISGYALNNEQLLRVGYLAVFCTLYAQSAQLIGQRFTTANQSAIILSLEAVFGMLFSVFFGAETLSITLGFGFAIVFIAIIISEVNIDVKKLLTKKLKREKGEDYGK
ncbi:MAG: DMT family transporter [Clostridia bacterium]|nr:DMT family transporter [Clostridia bacterium]